MNTLNQRRIKRKMNKEDELIPIDEFISIVIILTIVNKISRILHSSCEEVHKNSPDV